MGYNNMKSQILIMVFNRCIFISGLKLSFLFNSKWQWKKNILKFKYGFSSSWLLTRKKEIIVRMWGLFNRIILHNYYNYYYY